MKTKTKTKSIKNLYSKLCKCNKEEEVKAEYCKYFGMKLNAVGNIDHYHPNVLFEFKYDKVMSKAEVRATVVAQAVYYVHDLMYGKSTLAIPPAIGVVDKNEGFYVKTSEVADLASGEYEWQRPASSPDSKLVEAVQKALGDTVTLYSFSDAEACAAYEECTRSHLEGNGEPVKKKITCGNLLDVYERWKELFGEYVFDKIENIPAREYFKADMVEGKSGLSRDGKFIEFDLPGGTRKKQLIISDYENFWRVYEKLNQAEAVKVMTKADLLLSMQKRRFNGDFYTPVEFAELACEKVEGLLGKWWERGEYRLWDMAAGTGNLELPLPAEALKYCYMSTLDKADADYLDLTFGRAGATCFQYDFLNDDVADAGIGTDKLPENLQKDLADPNVKWIVLINPPYASAGNANLSADREKKEVSFTNIRKLMHVDGCGKSSNELYTQFIYRVQRQFAGTDTHLCMLSTTKYVWGASHSKLREKFTGILQDGFFMPSMAFGLKGKFPILFACWQLVGKYSNNSDTSIAVYDENCKIIGHKQVTGVLSRDVINEWIKQEGKRTELSVPFTSAFNVVKDSKKVAPQDVVVPGHLFTYVNRCNDIQHQSGQLLMSGSYADAHDMSVTTAVADKSIVQFAVKQTPEATWYNWDDMFTVPHTEPMNDTEFVNDCWAYAMFANKNYTTAQKDVEYKGKKYQIRNELFPFMPTKVQAWKCSHTDIATQLAFKPQASFAAKRMAGQALSAEAQAVMDAGEEVYKFFYENLHNTRWKEANIDYWDVGWIQVKTACKTLTGDLLKEYKKLDKKLLEARKALRAKLLEKVYSYGFKCKDIEPLS